VDKTKGKVKEMFKLVKSKYLAVCAMVAAFALAALPASALAIESEGTKKIGEVTTKVSGEGTEIILAVLGGLVALIALVIVLPKAVGFIRRFI
jgi:hypothetical protein